MKIGDLRDKMGNEKYIDKEVLSMMNVLGQKKIFSRYIILMVVLVLFSACKNQGDSSNPSSDNQSVSTTTKIQTVEIVNPISRSFSGEVLITGTAQPDQSVMLYPMEGGMIVQMRKDIGDKVNKGETIAVLSNPIIEEKVAEAKASLAISKAQLKTKRADLQAEQAKANGLQSISKRLSDIAVKTPQLTSMADVETAKANATAATAMTQSKEAYVEAQQETIKAMEIKLQTAQKRLSFLSIRAPFSGVITKRFVDKGSLLQSGMNQKNPQAVVELQATNTIRLTLPVPESDAVSIHKGMDVKVSFPELSSKIYDTKISRTSGALDPLSKTMQVEVDIPNKDGKILTGMYAKAMLQVGSREDILSLPIFSKLRYKNENYVMVVEEDVVKRIPIKIGLSDKDYFEVLNGEINENTNVIVNGKGLVKVGQKVKGIKK